MTTFAADYERKRDYYLDCARTARRQMQELPEKHRENLRLLVSRYAFMARKMNWNALSSRRVEHEREFRRRMQKA